jgi:hypothetical protein
MIQMACPRCGAGGRVPREKVNSRLVCKKCLQVFYLTPAGQAVAGEPPLPKEQPRQRASRQKIEIDAGDLFEGVGQKLSKIKLPSLKTLGIVGVVLLIVAAGAWMFSRQSIEKRTQVLAAALSKGDLETVVGLAMAGTEMEAITWSAKVFDQYSSLKVSFGGVDPGITIQIQGQGSGNSAQALVVYSREGAARPGQIPLDLPPSPSLSNAKQSLELVLYWTLDTWGNWRLDARRTLEAFQSSP